MTLEGKNFISLGDFNSAEILSLVHAAIEAKRGNFSPALTGKTLVAIFFNPSLRTRISFQVAMQRLGGHTISLNAGNDLWAIEFQNGTIIL